MGVMNNKDTRQAGLALIEEKLAVARAAIKEAEEIAKQYNVDFNFSIGDGSGYYETYEERNGKIVGDWYGWQGSSC